MSEWVKKRENPTVFFLPETHFKYKYSDTF